MKRSEAVSQLMQLLVMCRIEDFGYRETAEEVLNLLESRGMQPPFNENNEHHASERDADGYEWEKEDA